jgi:3-phenylpropionate/trans-cinnamate dioxygenase ferredoxin subunit
METAKFGSAKDLPIGDMKVVRDGDREILLVNLGSRIFALDNFCAHNGCRLGYGTLTGENLRCPCHSSVFNVRTGEVVSGPATTPQPTYTVILKDGEITLAP